MNERRKRDPVDVIRYCITCAEPWPVNGMYLQDLERFVIGRLRNLKRQYRQDESRVFQECALCGHPEKEEADYRKMRKDLCEVLEIL